MPHLHTMDFDLSPKSGFDHDTRWGNSNPVFILSLLEIVEQENDVHIQEAAPRLKPGWVRNACAAFEQGMAFSNFDSVNNLQNQESGKKASQDLKQNNTLEKQVPKNHVPARREERNRSSALQKSRSLESLNANQNVVKKGNSSVLKSVKKDVDDSSLMASKEKQEDLLHVQNVSKLKRSISTSDKSLPSTKRKVPITKENLVKQTRSSEAASASGVWWETLPGPQQCNKGKRLGDKYQQSKKPTSRELTSRHTTKDADATPSSTVASACNGVGLDSCKPSIRKRIPQFQKDIQSGDVCDPASLNYDKPSIRRRIPQFQKDIESGDVCDPASLNNDNDCHDVNVLRKSSHVLDQVIASTYKDDVITVCKENSSTDPPFISLDQTDMVDQGEDKQQRNKSKTSNHHCDEGYQQSILLAGSLKDLSQYKSEGPAQPIHDGQEPSVRPKESHSLVKDVTCHLNKEDGAIPSARNVVMNQGTVSVCIKSSAYGIKQQQLGPCDLPDEGVTQDAVFQSAMCQSVAVVKSQDLPPTTNNAIEVVVVGKKLDSGPEATEMLPSNHGSEPQGISVTIQERWKYPPELLEVYLLSKNSDKFDDSIEWKTFNSHFTSYRHLSISRPRFTASFRKSICGELDKTETSTDHLVNLKRAFDKKWSRCNSLTLKRGSKNFGSFYYQVRNHPLAYHDPYETEESESESEDEVNDDVTYFSLIPTYILARIFRCLNTRDLAALKCTCWDFHWLINQFDIAGSDTKWVSGAEYRNDPCMHCGKIRDPRGDVSLCRRHPKIFYRYSHIGRCYWTCCNAIDKGTVGCQIGLHNNKWTTANFEPYFICKPWRSMAWYVTANNERWCDKEHL